MAQKKYRKYASSTSPSRQIQQSDDPQPSKETTDYGFLIGALTRQVLEKGLMDNKFKKFFSLPEINKKRKVKNKDRQQRENSNSVQNIQRKTKNQEVIMLVEEFAKEHNNISFEEQVKYQQFEPIILQPNVYITKDKEWIDIFEKFKSQNLKIIPNQQPSEFINIINNNQITTRPNIKLENYFTQSQLISRYKPRNDELE